MRVTFLLSSVALLPQEVHLLQFQQVHIQTEQRVHNGWMPSEGDWEPAEAQSGFLVWSLLTAMMHKCPSFTFLQFNVVFSTQHHLCVFWRRHTEPGSSLDHCCSAGNCLQTGASRRWCRGHAWGEPYSHGKVEAGGLPPSWCKPFFYWHPGEITQSIIFRWLATHKNAY